MNTWTWIIGINSVNDSDLTSLADTARVMILFPTGCRWDLRNPNTVLRQILPPELGTGDVKNLTLGLHRPPASWRSTQEPHENPRVAGTYACCGSGAFH